MLNDLRPRINLSAHPDNDRWSLYEFERRSGLPHGYFDKGVSADAVIVGLAIVVLALVCIGLALGELT